MEKRTILSLLKAGDPGSFGAFGYDRERGPLHYFRAKAVVSGDGGNGRAYKITTPVGNTPATPFARVPNPARACVDMEFIHFSSHRDGLAADRARHSRPRRRCGGLMRHPHEQGNSSASF